MHQNALICVCDTKDTRYRKDTKLEKTQESQDSSTKSNLNEYLLSLPNVQYCLYNHYYYILQFVVFLVMLCFQY